MITVIDGAPGSGKTIFMCLLIRKEWRAGFEIYSNFPMWFDPDRTRINRWHSLDEVYNLENGIMAIDEGQKLFDARRWASLPITFAEKIAQHRHHHLDIYTTTQDMGHIDKRIRDNVHAIYSVRSVFRFPRNERVKPILQISRVVHKSRSMAADGRLLWKVDGARTLYISRFWTREYYNTYATIGMDRFLCKIKSETKGKKRKWKIKIYSRQLVNSGKARL